MVALLIVAVVVVGGAVLFGLRVLQRQTRAQERIDEDLRTDGGTPTLEYVLPAGQDPVVVLAALEQAGYTATTDPHGDHQRVLIACPGGLDRERAHVRSLIASANTTAPQDGAPVDTDVRFADER